MKNLHLFPAIILALSGLGCSKLSNNYKEINLVCGLEKQINTEDIRLVQVLGANGASLSSDQLSSLRGRLVTPDDRKIDLAFTPNGCTIIPKEKGTIQFISQEKGT